MKYFVPEKEVLVAATGIQSVMAYAGVAQADDDGKGMQRVPRPPGSLDLLGHVGQGLSPLSAFQPPDSDPWQYR